MEQRLVNLNSLTAWIKKRRYLCILALIAVLSFMLNFYAVSKFGYGNAYYAAAIKSMTLSFKNFFFISFDPAGIVSVDKPPIALWIQAIFVMIFGYHGWAMLLPQALAGTGSCIMMYILTAKHFGRPAGLLAAFFFALTPAAVVASRNNTMDMQLVFVLLVATWYFFKALETSKWRYLFIAAVFVGIGFNVKMLQAYMILPAMCIVYLIFAKENFVKRLLAGLIALVIVAAVSFSWVLAVDLYPADSRPYVGSSTDNTEFELIIGHNGLQRIYQGIMRPGSNAFFGGNSRPQSGGGFGNRMPAGNRTAGAQDRTSAGGAGNQPPQSRQQPQNGQQSQSRQSQSGQQNFGAMPGFNGFDGFGGWNMARGSGGNNIGTAGVFRLWGKDLYGQASWLIVFSLFSILIWIKKFSRKELNTKQAAFIYWILWLAVMYAFFSFAGFYHRYYLCMFAPAVAALSGIGFINMLKSFREKRDWRQFILPVSLIITSLISVVYVMRWYTGLKSWLVPLIILSAALSLIFMALNYIKDKRFMCIIASAFMLLSLLAAPFYWCLTAAVYPPQNSTMPYAGPELASPEQYGGSKNQETFITSDANTVAIEKYLVSHYKSGTYLVVSQSSADVAAFIIDTGLPAVAYGGFLGTDKALTLDRIKELVEEGKITYFLLSTNSSGNSQITNYVKSNAALINISEYGGSANSGYTLYKF